jgi:hypothetical protein
MLCLMKKNVYLFGLISLLFSAACSTQRVAVLTPNIPTQYLDREGFATQKSDSLDVTFGYLFSTKDHLVFEVSVKNKSGNYVYLDPQDFSFQSASLLNANNLSEPLQAHSFAQVTKILDDRIRERNIKAAVVVLAVVATAVAIEVASKNNASPRSSRSYNDYSFATNLTTDLSFNFFDALIYNHLSKKEAKKGLERTLMFPRTLAPSESHIGTVYFPRDDNAKQLLFNFKVGNQDFKTLFQQTIQLKGY